VGIILPNKTTTLLADMRWVAFVFYVLILGCLKHIAIYCYFVLWQEHSWFWFWETVLSFFIASECLCLLGVWKILSGK